MVDASLPQGRRLPRSKEIRRHALIYLGLAPFLVLAVLWIARFRAFGWYRPVRSGHRHVGYKLESGRRRDPR